MSMIHIENLTKAYGGNVILENINLEVEQGECISVIGPSGGGKSTLLRCINLLETPTSGRVFINGQEITARGAPLDEIRRHMGMVYQSFNLFSHKTVLENVMMAPIALGGMSQKDALALAMDCLEQVGMGERADFMPQALSGGQKQRAAIARCMAITACCRDVRQRRCSAQPLQSGFRILEGQTVHHDMFHINLQDRGKGQVPVRRCYNNHVCLAELPSQSKHLILVLPCPNQEISFFQCCFCQRHNGQIFQDYPVHHPILTLQLPKVFAAQESSSGFRMGADAGIDP